MGTAMVLFTRGRDLVLNPGTLFELELKRPMKFAYNEIEFTSSQLNSAGHEVRPRPAQSMPRNPGFGRRLPFPGIGIPVLLR